MRLCAGKGRLVPAGGFISPEPFDFVYATAPYAWGCNHLRCRKCGEIVRSHAKWFANPTDDPRLIELGFAGDLTTLEREKRIEPSDANRWYVCRCYEQSLGFHTWLDEAPDEQFVLPPWECAGHPALAIPSVVDGVAIDASSDWPEILRRAWSGRLAREVASAAPFEGEWVNRLWQLTQPGAVADAIARAAIARVSDEDAAVAVCALVFFSQNAELTEAAGLIAAYRAEPERFERENPSFQGKRLFFWLLQAIGSRVRMLGARDPETLEFAREQALAPGEKPGTFLSALKRADAAWVNAHRAEWELANRKL